LPNRSVLSGFQPTLFRLSAVMEMQQNPAKLGFAPKPDMQFCR
jgi:hypothetical protein